MHLANKNTLIGKEKILLINIIQKLLEFVKIMNKYLKLKIIKKNLIR